MPNTSIKRRGRPATGNQTPTQERRQVSISQALHEQAAAYAKATGRSMGGLAEIAIREYLDTHKLSDLQIEKNVNGVLRIYPGREQPQPAFIELNCRAETLRADFDPEIETPTVPGYVYNRWAIRWPIPCRMSPRQINELMQEIRPLADRVIAGYSEREHHGDMIGQLDADAQAASDEIAAACRELMEDPELR